MAKVSASLADSLDQTRVRHIEVEGVRTRYYEAGAGEPLVLLHGGHFGFIDSLDCWSLNFAGLAAEFHVLNQAGHYCFREHPHEFNRLLRSFCLR
jgi:pimeloyl-ACP methyl ester carboxylesterase